MVEQQQMTRTRRRLVQSNSTWPFPLAVTTEILSRLPEKSVARFRCVSKLWSSITADSYFINLFETRSPRPSLLLCYKEEDTLFVSSISEHHHTLHNSNKSYSCSQPIVRYHMKFPASGSSMPPTESVHGLVCFQDSAAPVVWNPSKRQFLALPKPRNSWSDIAVLLGYDPIEGKHKVVCLPFRRSGDVCRILTLGVAQESWRTVKTNHKHRTEYFQTSGRCIKGVVYYLAYVYQTHVWVIMSFDVRSEKFDMIQFPLYMGDPMLITYEGRVSCIDTSYNHKENSIKIWLLEDAEKHIWSSKEILAPLQAFDEKLQATLVLKGVTNAGEFIYAPSTFRKSGYVLFCDPVRNSFRKFELKGIVDDECGLNQGVQNLLMDNAHYLHAFPNHMESQMSL